MDFYPDLLIQVYEGVLRFVLGLAPSVETRAAVQNVEDDVVFVEHEISLTLLQESSWQGESRLDVRFRKRPCATLTTSVADFRDDLVYRRRQSYLLEDRSHRDRSSMPPSKVCEIP